MTTLAICAIFRDEGLDLREWVAYHRAVGVDYFFLYDNESNDDGASVLLTGPLKDYLTVVPMAGRPVQQRAYRHFIDFHMSHWDWTAFIDIDEFIHPTETDSIKDLLPRYEAFSGVLLHWLTFGPSGHDTRPKGLVIENYTHRLPKSDPVNRHVKTLVRGGHLLRLLGNAHVFDTKGPLCNSRGEPVPRKPVQNGVCHEVICLNHYYTKSREDWNAKQGRGRPDVPELRADPQYELFEKYARLSKITDERMMRYAARVRAILSTQGAFPPDSFQAVEGSGAVRKVKFDANIYLALHKDVAEAGMNPEEHYLRYGQYEGRRLR
jgi:O-antigen biosynthesis protein